MGLTFTEHDSSWANLEIDNVKTVVFRTTPTKQSALLLFLCLPSILSFIMCYFEVHQKFLSYAFWLQCSIFTKLEVDNLDFDELLQLFKLINGIAVFGVIYNEAPWTQQELGSNICATAGDHLLVYNRVANRLVGLSGSYVDAIFVQWPYLLQESMYSTRRRFKQRHYNVFFTLETFQKVRVMTWKTDDARGKQVSCTKI